MAGSRYAETVFPSSNWCIEQQFLLQEDHSPPQVFPIQEALAQFEEFILFPGWTESYPWDLCSIKTQRLDIGLK